MRMSRGTRWVSVECSKSHSRFCSLPEHTRTDFTICKSLSASAQPWPVRLRFGRLACFHPAQLDSEKQQLKKLGFEQMMYSEQLEKTHDSMGQDRNRNPVANSLQTALEPCPLSSALLYHLLLENLIQLHPVVQSSEAAAFSAFKFLLADLNGGVALP